MRTGSWLWTAALATALPSIFVGCGDDSPVGGSGGAGGGQGGVDPTGGSPTGGFGGDGAGGSGGFPVNDDCDSASAIAVAAGEEISVQGTLQGAADDLKTFCADDGTPPNITATDVVYELTLADACTLSLTLAGSAGMNAVLSARTNCAVDDRCANGSTGGSETMLFHADSGPLFVIVSDLNSTDATFQLTVECATPECGDFVKDTDEDCDDGNTTAGDGCDTNCAYEPTNPEIDNCAGAEPSVGTAIASGEIVRISDALPVATTIGATGDETGGCLLQTDGTDAPDHVYKIIPSDSGTLSATIGLGLTGVLGETDIAVCGEDQSVPPLDPHPTGCYDRAIYIREICTDPTSELACTDDPTDWYNVETATTAVVAGVPYFVFVDGYYDDAFGAGPYVLRLELQ